MINEPNLLKRNFFDGEQDYNDKGEWCLSEQVDEYVTHVSKLVIAIEKYGFPDGTEIEKFRAVGQGRRISHG